MTAMSIDTNGTKLKMYKNDLVAYLRAVDALFPVPLSQKIVIEEYADKLLQRATLVCSSEHNKLMGLAAGYTENLPESNMAYLALVGVRPEGQRKGLGSCLVNQFISIARQSGAKGLHLYTHPSNDKAIAMYLKLGFSQIHIPGDPRKDDVHFQLLFKENKE